MALRVLTNQEKEDLKKFTDFKEECKWGLLNKAAYWKDLDGTAVPGGQNAASLARWAKSRAYAAQLNSNPAQVNPDQNQMVADRFLVYIKNIACVNDQAAFDPAAVVAILLASPFHFEAMADKWFDDTIATSQF